MIYSIIHIGEVVSTIDYVVVAGDKLRCHMHNINSVIKVWGLAALCRRELQSNITIGICQTQT